MEAEGRRAFLLSFDQNEKYVPQDGQKLIHCNPDWGPIFGGGIDLRLSDGCNACTSSSANFPGTYNRAGNSKIVNSQQSYADFSGATAGHKFRVVEYEVGFE
jgi:hypothetical protein